MTWREQARMAIEETLSDIPFDADEKELRRVLRAAYPFGPRENHPYKIWCDEVRKTIVQRFKPLPLFDQTKGNIDEDNKL